MQLSSPGVIPGSIPLHLSCNGEHVKGSAETLDTGFKNSTPSYSQSNTVKKRNVTQSCQHITSTEYCMKRILFVANPVRNRSIVYAIELIAFLILYLLCGDVHCRFFRTPLNAAKLTGERVVLNCSSGDFDSPCGNLAWVHYKAKTSEQTDISMQGRLSPLVSDYISLIDSTKGNCDLEIKARSSAEGKYECISVSASAKASSELIVLESAPECFVKTGDIYFNVTCWVRYYGDWCPEMKWIQANGQSINSSESNSVTDQIVSSTIRLPQGNTSDGMSSGYMCCMKFSEEGRQAKTSATNVPDYEWMSPIFGGIEEFKEIIAVEKCENKSHLYVVIGLIVSLVLVSMASILLWTVKRFRRLDSKRSQETMARVALKTEEPP